MARERLGTARHLAAAGLLALAASPAAQASAPAAREARLDACFEQAGLRYGIAPQLLRAIAWVESAMDPRALNANRDGTHDIGLMQVNSRWLLRLARFGLRPQDLWDPCTNVHVGAWILAHAIRRWGYTWEAVGAYHAGDRPAAAARRARYAERVRRRLAALEEAAR